MLLFEIHQQPRPQKQTRFSKRGAYDPSKKDKESIVWQIRPFAPKDPFKGPVEIDITFYLPIPKKTGKNKCRQMVNQTILPVVRPDIDNLAYIVTNAMKGIYFEDDSQVVDLILHKRYGDSPKTVIKLREVA